MTTTKTVKYYSAIGRRKTARARVRLYPGKGGIRVNDQDGKKYFPELDLQEIIFAPLKELGVERKFDLSILIRGGGIHSQAEATRMGISRALVEFNPEWKAQLKTSGYLSRDPRGRERKKYGLKRARRAAQWTKR